MAAAAKDYSSRPHEPQVQPPNLPTAAGADPTLAEVAVAATTISASQTLIEVNDEIHEERSEVNVFATVIFENCPDEMLSEDYLVSLKKFILSENHLQKNIKDIKTLHLTSRQLNDQSYFHTVSVEICVKTAHLWEPPRAYIQKHLARNDWLRGNKTRITFDQIHVK